MPRSTGQDTSIPAATPIAHRTTILVAHRLTTLRDADRILVFDAGHIVEEGTYDDLMKDYMASGGDAIVSSPSGCASTSRGSVRYTGPRGSAIASSSARSTTASSWAAWRSS